jgi:NADH-quinone oxidoreductase subunit J
MFKTAIFYLLSAVLIFAALRVITTRNPVHAALFLVLSFFNMAGIWLLLQAEFLGIALVLVYVGAVMVLFLFVVMMLDIDIAKLRAGFWSYLPLAATISVVVVLEMVLVLAGGYFGTAQMPNPPSVPVDYSNTKELGRLIYTDYVYPFEIASVILLVAIIAAIALTLRRRKGTKKQDVARQLAVRKADRVRLVTMPAEKVSSE